MSIAIIKYYGTLNITCIASKYLLPKGGKQKWGKYVWIYIYVGFITEVIVSEETHGYHRKVAARLLRQLPIPDKKTKKQVKRKLMTRTYYWSGLKRFGLPGIRFVTHCCVNSKGSGTLIGL
ncbi:hypothetical protein [Legionella pneumophila]|uniref:hypothetical protein n=1 Tax=Legionella pneumophila TaxID=446 RepID=UPI001EE01102|nr:hypothetical protein [Legionella pneumophila]